MQVGLTLQVEPYIHMDGTEEEAFARWLERLEAALGEAKQAGADYAELPLSILAELPEEQFEQVLAVISRAEIAVPVTVWLLPAGMKAVGPEADQTALTAYLEHAFARASKLGAEIVVFGSGRARTVPDGWTKDEGLAQLEQLLHRCDALAAEYGLLVAFEPLNRRETNLIRFLEDAIELAARLYLPRIRVLADAYHMNVMREEYDSVEEACEMGLLAHAHIASSTRGYPLPEGAGEKAESFVSSFLAALKHGGYEGRISIEALEEGADPGEGTKRRSLAYLRQLSEETGPEA